MRKLDEPNLLAPQSGALSRLAFRDTHPTQSIPSTYRFDRSKPLYDESGLTLMKGDGSESG